MISLFLFSGCSNFLAKKNDEHYAPKAKVLGLKGKNYLFSGRIFFKNSTTKQSGELNLQISISSELKLSIFAPIVGSLIYELRANEEKILITNYQKNNYLLARNKHEIRTDWLGMDLTLTELNCLILGKLPKDGQDWTSKLNPNGELSLIKGDVKIIITFNDSRQIESMRKFVNGQLEYRAIVPIYKQDFGTVFPGKIRIDNKKGNTRWVIIFSDLQIIEKSDKPLDFNIPKKLEPIFSD